MHFRNNVMTGMILVQKSRLRALYENHSNSFRALKIVELGVVVLTPDFAGAALLRIAITADFLRDSACRMDPEPIVSSSQKVPYRSLA